MFTRFTASCFFVLLGFSFSASSKVVNASTTTELPVTVETIKPDSKVEYVTQQKLASNPLNIEEIKQKFSELLGAQILTVTPTPMSNLVELMTEQGLIYASADGDFLVQGKLYGLGGGTVVNHTEEALEKLRMVGLEKYKDDMIVYAAKDEKHVVTIFTDITCGYCRQLHQQMSEYNDLGITVRYLPYPRSGVKDRLGRFSKGFKDLRSIWCHEDPASALTKAKSGANVNIPQRICDKPLEDEFNFARQVGVNSTPAIIFDNGVMLPGYQKPSSLLKIIESIKEES